MSLRGTSPERSSKITLMEDGVLVAPAPYSAPAAYYFPNVARMQAVEVLKGSSQIQYGPFTTGGAINFVSTEIPNSFQGEIKSNYGSFGTTNTLARFGDSYQNIGYSIEYMKNKSDGFKDLDGPGGTGFDRNDIVGKIRINTNPDAKIYQSLELKLQYSDEDSDETYLGLTQEDFDKTPFRRYAGSQVDNMRTFHRQVMLTHMAEFTKNIVLTTTFYNNEFDRNWFKLDRVVSGVNTVGISDLLENPNDFPQAFSYITGSDSA
ncbi:TonB-dependent receptor plug domain-containing protein [Flavobacterium sp. CS20]|uniref:TonB-dependent receptor plug domain-containing protein n=1 Tax=Flavobacterium sp. CS20 TaxID=2775246 RepID=UPI0035305011